MSSSMRKLKTKKKRRRNPESVRLRGIYRNLSTSYEKLQLILDQLRSPSEIAVVAVLEDDLHSLVEEAEEYLIGGCVSEQLYAFESRSFTVLEELRTLDILGSASASEYCA